MADLRALIGHVYIYIYIYTVSTASTVELMSII